MVDTLPPPSLGTLVGEVKPYHMRATLGLPDPSLPKSGISNNDIDARTGAITGHSNQASPQGTSASSSKSIATSSTTPDKSKVVRRKQPMRDFEWGGDLVRKTLPARILPRWLDPYHVDVADPTELPLCWYGVPFVRKLVYPYAERIGLASYYTRQVLRAKPGDLDTFQTWANLDVWFRKQTGLQLDLNLVWGQPTPILTFCSNYESPNVTKEQLSLICDFLDGMDYEEEYQLMWYLDRNLDY